MHRCEHVGTKHVRFPVNINPRGFKGPQPLGTPFSPIFRRATKDGATGGRWFSRAVGKNRTAKHGVPRSKSPWVRRNGILVRYGRQIYIIWLYQTQKNAARAFPKLQIKIRHNLGYGKGACVSASSPSWTLAGVPSSCISRANALSYHRRVVGTKFTTSKSFLLYVHYNRIILVCKAPRGCESGGGTPFSSPSKR